MDYATPGAGAQLVTPTGFVDAETTTAADVILWGDAVAVRALLRSRDPSTLPGWQHTAA